MAASDFTDDDALYLRRAIAQSARAAALGNRPFGAVIVSHDGQLLAQAFNNNATTGDCSGHAEVNALRQATPRVPREFLAQATLYSSAEPCVMCAGAIFWSGVGRVVFGIDAERLRGYRARQPGAGDLEWSVREVFARSPRPITVVGPVLADEAAGPHERYWAEQAAAQQAQATPRAPAPDDPARRWPDRVNVPALDPHHHGS